jgi:hypothetical protein
MRRPPFAVRLISAPDGSYRVGLTVGTDTYALSQDEADMLAYLLQRGKPRSAMDPDELHKVMDRLGWPDYAPDRS